MCARRSASSTAPTCCSRARCSSAEGPRRFPATPRPENSIWARALKCRGSALPAAAAGALVPSLLVLLSLGARLGAMGFLPSPAQRAVWAAGDDFRAGDVSAAAAALDPWVPRSAQAAREDLALRFLSQDYGGVQALAYSVATATQDDES